MGWLRMDRATLTVTVELASGTLSETKNQRDQALDRLYEQIETTNAERNFVDQAFNASPDAAYTTLIAAQAEQPVDYLLAMQRTLARHRAAEAAGHREWMAKQMTAARKYAALAAQALRPATQSAEDEAAKLKSAPYAMRRPAPAAAAFMDNLKRDGLSAEHRKALAAAGLDEKEIANYQAAMQATPAGEVGISIAELYVRIAEYKRLVAKDLNAFADGALTPYAEPRLVRFVVGNPHDRTELVELTIRRISIPADWKLSIVNAPLPVPSTPTAGGQKKADSPQVSEIRPGQRYQVTLPAKTEVRVASVVVPVGETGVNTTARWAVEGRIGNELLGGIVHEMHVPAMLADLQLPPIAPAATTTAASATAVWGFRSPLVWLAAAISVLLAGILFIAWRRKRSRA
jgi:hypothetical protein